MQNSTTRKKILVTGATGFVGSTLCDELTKHGHEVRALMRATSSSANLSMAKFSAVKGDLRDAGTLVEAVSDVDVIFHVAGVVAARSREDFFAANADGTKNLVEAARKNNKNLQRFVYVSSLAAAGPSTPQRPNCESDESKPVSDYGASKLAGEKEALLASQDFPVSVVRPPAVYGPRDRGVYSFFQTISKGFLPLLGLSRPDPRRYSFVHVDDLVQGILLAGFSPEVRTGDVFYVAGEGEYSWEQAMRFIAEGMQKKTLPLPLPLPVMKGAAAISTIYGKVFDKTVPLSLDKIKEIEAMAWTCSSAKAQKQLKFKPYWDLQKGLAATAQWYKDNGWL